MPVIVHTMERKPKGSGILLAGATRRGRGRPRKSDMSGGLSLASIMDPIIKKTAKKIFSSPKEFGKALGNVPKFVFDKKTWENAGNFLNDKSVKAERGKFDKLIVKLLDAIPVAGPPLAKGYTDKIINQPTKGDIKGSILEGIRVNDMVKKAVRDNFGIVLPKTPMEYLLEGDLDGMQTAIKEQAKLEPKILELIGKVSGEQMIKTNLENKDNLWYDPVARKQYYGDEAKAKKAEYLKANPQAQPTGSGMKLSGSGCGCGCGCDMCGSGLVLPGASRGKGLKLSGGSYKSQIVARMIGKKYKKFDPDLVSGASKSILKMRAKPPKRKAKKFDKAKDGDFLLEAEFDAVAQDVGDYLAEKEINKMTLRPRKVKGSGMRQPSRWVQHVKQYARDHGIKYNEALTQAKDSYQR